MMIVSLYACTNHQDIDLVYHHDVLVEINTLDLYQNSGIDVVKFQTLMGTGIYKPCVTILVYNPDGTLNQKQEILTDDLRQISCTLQNLDQKEYDIIATQHFVQVANGKVSSTWKLEDEDNIRTVHISNTSLTGEIYWFNCLGIYSNKVTITKNSKIEISTNLAGSFIDFKCENFNLSKYCRLGLYFKDKADGLFLNPGYQGNDRYFYAGGFNAPNVWGIASLFYYNIKQYESEIRFVFESGKINYCFGLSTESDKLDDGRYSFKAFPSQNSYIDIEQGKRHTAFCYYNGYNDKIETFIGSTTEFSDWYDNLDKWIIPDFEQPYVLWGSSVAEVKRYMEDKNYKLWFDIRESDGMYWLGYEGKFSEDNIQYIFSSETNDLIVSMVAIPQSKLNTEEILSLFDENLEYKRIKLFDECYQLYGCYIYINDNTQVQIYPDGQWDNGEKFTSIQYFPRTYEDVDAMMSKRFIIHQVPSYVDIKSLKQKHM